MLPLHFMIDLLNQVIVVPNRLVVLHDHLVALEGFHKPEVNFVSKGTHVEDLTWDLVSLGLRVVDGFLDGSDRLASQTQLDASESEPVVSVGPIFPDRDRLLELLLRLRVLVILLVVASEVENGWRVRRVQLEGLLVALQCRLKGIIVLIEHNALMVPELWVHVGVDLLGSRGGTLARLASFRLTLQV